MQPHQESTPCEQHSANGEQSRGGQDGAPLMRPNELGGMAVSTQRGCSSYLVCRTGKGFIDRIGDLGVDASDRRSRQHEFALQAV
jgi:hypothetical protein